MGTGSALAAFGSNIGKQAVGSTKLAANLGTAAVKTIASIPARRKAAKVQRKIDAENKAQDREDARIEREERRKERKRKVRKAALIAARRIGYQSEEFIYEVEDMKNDKLDRVIDIMRGKNKIEVMPKESNVRESVKIEDANGNHYAEFIDIIKPEPLKASKGIGSEILDEKCWVGYKQKGMKKKGDRMVPNCVKEGHSNWRQELGESAAWTRKEGKEKSGGLNEKGRKSYERENPGSDLKAPSKKVGNKRRASFCSRMKGMKKKLTSKKTANDPNSRINKSLRAWNC